MRRERRLQSISFRNKCLPLDWQHKAARNQCEVFRARVLRQYSDWWNRRNKLATQRLLWQWKHNLECLDNWREKHLVHHHQRCLIRSTISNWKSDQNQLQDLASMFSNKRFRYSPTVPNNPICVELPSEWEAIEDLYQLCEHWYRFRQLQDRPNQQEWKNNVARQEEWKTILAGDFEWEDAQSNQNFIYRWIHIEWTYQQPTRQRKGGKPT